MRSNKALFISCACLALTVFLIAGCGGTESLDLPEKEMKQLEAKSQKSDTVSGKGKPVTLASGKRFYVYAERGYFKNHFVPSGWMGGYSDLKFNEGWKENPRSRRTCIRVDYSAERKQGAGWAGIYWQEPANNWGNLSGGYDLTGAKALTFYARGENGGEIITEFKMGGIQGEFSDSTSVSIGPIVLTPEWNEYTIDLADEDLSRVIGGFAFVVSEMENPDGATFYLDEITYE